MPQVTNKRRFDELLIWAEEFPELNQTGERSRAENDRSSPDVDLGLFLVWNQAETIIRDILSKNKMPEAPSRRPWSLTKAVDSASSSGPTALLLDQ